MSEAKHTQGKAIPAVSSVSQIGPCYAVGMQDTKVAIAITGKFDKPDSDISEANARRLAACWNACDGFSIEELEGADLFKDSIESGNLINELLAALEKIVEMNVQWALDQHGDATKAENMDCVRVARAAIAKATGGEV